jgi:type IV pilus assembly protein PilM
MATRFLSLNIGASTVALAEYEAGSKGALTLVNYGVAKLGAPLDSGSVATILTPALLEIVREKGIKPGKVGISVSGQMVFPKIASIPSAGGSDKFDQMVRYEIEQSFPFPADEMVCDSQVLGDTETGDKSVMIVAAKVEQIEEITSAVAGAGFEPEKVDAAPIALVNAIKFNSENPDECVIALDIGSKITSLVIVEGDKLYSRSIPVAGSTITKEIAQALGCTLDEAEAIKQESAYVSVGGVTEDEDQTLDRIAKVCRAVMTRLNAEISRSINFYRSQQNGAQPVKLYLTGGSALLPEIDTFFAESLSLEVEFLNPFERVRLSRRIDEEAIGVDAALLASTVGVALNMTDSARFAINLLPPSIVDARAEKAKIPFVAAGGVALVAALAVVWLGVNREIEVLQSRYDVVQAEKNRLENLEKKVKANEQQFESESEEAQKLRTIVTSRAAAVQRMRVLQSAVSKVEGAWIEKWENGRMTVRAWKDRIKPVAGKTTNERVEDALKSSREVDATKVRTISHDTKIDRGDQIEQFTVEVKFK